MQWGEGVPWAGNNHTKASTIRPEIKPAIQEAVEETNTKYHTKYRMLPLKGFNTTRALV